MAEDPHVAHQQLARNRHKPLSHKMLPDYPTTESRSGPVAGKNQKIPKPLRHKGANLGFVTDHMWKTLELLVQSLSIGH
jgi:hypothetical protein